jgi:hypothetical protein
MRNLCFSFPVESKSHTDGPYSSLMRIEPFFNTRTPSGSNLLPEGPKSLDNPVKRLPSGVLSRVVFNSLKSIFPGV